VPDRSAQAQQLRALGEVLATGARRQLTNAQARVEGERRALESVKPEAQLAAQRESVGLLLDRATRAALARLGRDRATLDRGADRLRPLLLGRTATARAALTRYSAGLDALDPFATLERGYAIVRRPDGHVVVDAATQRAGDSLEVRLARGALDVSVDGVRDSSA
jgi:exodeoxyribonuclease VII large subunit